jgi:hypothetical protein
MEPRNRCQGINSASLCSLAGRYDNPIPSRCLAPIEFLKIPAHSSIPSTHCHKFPIYSSTTVHQPDMYPTVYKEMSSILADQLRPLVGSLKMNTALEYSTRVVQEGDRRCKKSTLNDLAYLTPLRIPLMNPVLVYESKCGGRGELCGLSQ